MKNEIIKDVVLVALMVEIGIVLGLILIGIAL